MFSKDFFKIIKGVENSYIGFKPFRDGSTIDKFIIVACWFGFVLLSVLLFWAEISDKKSFSKITPTINLFIQCASPFLFLGYSIWFYTHLRKISRIENFLYTKGQSQEEETLNKFIFNIEKKGITSEFYPDIIDYYENKIKKDKNEKTNENRAYFAALLIPFCISYFSQNETLGLYCFILLILGIGIIPPIIFIVNSVTNKTTLYNNIIYYLKLQIRINKINEKLSNNLLS